MTTQTLNSPNTETASSGWQEGPSPLITLPGDLVNRYINVALRAALPKPTEGDQWYCALDQFPGVWAQEPSPKECLDVLAEVLREWLILKIVDRDRDLPVVDQIDLAVVSRRFPA